MSQVLTESVTLSTVGGMAGIVLGFLAAQVIAAVTPLPARLEPWSVILGIGITAAVGLFFGAYPASRAAHLDPIEALRQGVKRRIRGADGARVQVVPRESATCDRRSHARVRADRRTLSPSHCARRTSHMSGE